ncbi:hypothetical protein LIA77_11631 [Sarocladium implicatum]|nr:hypothetical protein LIA77_11631 [Sarocladium implicatum]
MGLAWIQKPQQGIQKLETTTFESMAFPTPRSGPTRESDRLMPCVHATRTGRQARCEQGARTRGEGCTAYRAMRKSVERSLIHALSRCLASSRLGRRLVTDNPTCTKTKPEKLMDHGR